MYIPSAYMNNTRILHDEYNDDKITWYVVFVFGSIRCIGEHPVTSTADG